MKLYTLLCISFFLLFTACNQDDDPVPPEVGSRTVLVYIVADNNLSSFAKEDVEEMIAGMESVDLSSSNLLVYQDDRVAPVLFRISRNKKGRLEKEIIKEYAEQVSTKASVMKEVMHRAFYEYPAEHMVKRHYGVRTERYKLIHFYNDINWWELYDMKTDPSEMHNLYGQPEYEPVVKELKEEMLKLQEQYNDPVRFSPERDKE